MTRDNLYNTKSGFEIKDLDSGNRQVAIYLSKFDTMDSDFDVIRKGAFAKSIKERGPEASSNRKIAFLRHHDWQKQIGLFTELKEDENGLFAVGKLGRSTDGEDAYRDYEDGIIKEHSIGFQYIQDKSKFIEDKSLESGGFYEISELKLYEGSAVTFGSNEFTNVVDVKGLDKTAKIKQISDTINTCVKALIKGQGTDERLYQIEMKIKHLTSTLCLLSKSEPAQIHSLDSQPSHTEVMAFDWNTVVKNLQS